MPEYFEANAYLGELIEGGMRGVIVSSPFQNLVEYLYWVFLACDGVRLEINGSELKIMGIGAERDALRVTVAVPVDADMVSGINFSELHWVGFVAAVDDESDVVAMPPVPILGVEMPS